MRVTTYLGLFRYLFWLSTLVGCIKEDLQICATQLVRIDFSFIRSIACAEQPITPSELNRLTVFLFDEKGIFVQQVDTIPTGTDYQLDISLVPAHYRFVAVAGYTADQLQGVPFIPGVTRIEDAAVATFVEQRDGSLLSAEHVLYLGSDTLTVKPETAGQEREIALTQRTKTLNVNVDGIATDRYRIALAGNAAAYRFFEDQQVYLTGNPPAYVPIHQQNGNFIGKTLINWPLKDEGNYTRFQIIDPVTGMRLVDEDFDELLMRVPGFQMDCASDFDVDIEYRTDGRLIISINGWKVYEEGYILI